MTRALNFPVHVDFNLTNACNLACLHCHASSGKMLPGELTTEEILSTIDQLYNNGVLSIVFAGGEPLVRKDLLQILTYAAAKSGLQVSIVTNGVLVSEVFARELAKAAPNLTLNVSLDGSTPERLAVLRKHRSSTKTAEQLFGMVTNGIRNSVTAGIRTAVNYTLTSTSLDDLDAVYRLAMGDLGCDGVVAIQILPVGEGQIHASTLQIPFKNWMRFFADLSIKKMDGQYPGLQVSVGSAADFYLPLIDASISFPAAESAWGYSGSLRHETYSRHRSIGDPIGVAQMCVDADGEIYPSVLLSGVKAYSFGNLRNAGIAELWESSPLMNDIEVLTLADLNSNCKTCGLREICGGGSRALALIAGRGLSGADPTCPLSGGRSSITIARSALTS